MVRVASRVSHPSDPDASPVQYNVGYVDRLSGIQLESFLRSPVLYGTEHVQKQSTLPALAVYPDNLRQSINQSYFLT